MKKTYTKPSFNITSVMSGNEVTSITTASDIQTTIKGYSYSSSGITTVDY